MEVLKNYGSLYCLFGGSTGKRERAALRSMAFSPTRMMAIAADFRIYWLTRFFTNSPLVLASMFYPSAYMQFSGVVLIPVDQLIGWDKLLGFSLAGGNLPAFTKFIPTAALRTLATVTDDLENYRRRELRQSGEVFFVEWIILLHRILQQRGKRYPR